MSEEDERLTHEIAALRREMARINAHRFVRLHDSPLRMMGFQFVRGLAFGLGSVMGATILVSIAVYVLAGIDFIPIVGEWASEIARQIRAEP